MILLLFFHTIVAAMSLKRTYTQPEYLKGIDPEFDEACKLAAVTPQVHLLHKDGIGLFVCVVRGDEVTGHPLIHPEQRGKKAVDAGKEAIKYWLNRGKQVRTRCFKHLKHARVYNRLIGLTPYDEDEEYIYYEVRP